MLLEDSMEQADGRLVMILAIERETLLEPLEKGSSSASCL